MKSILSLLLLCPLLSAAPATQVFNIRAFGATGDGTTFDTEAIQKTIDHCHAKGGGKVRIPTGKYHIGTIELKSKVTLSLDHEAYLLGSQDIKDYRSDLPKPREGRSHCLIYAADAKDITIEGLGVIDARGTPEAFPRNKRKRPPRPRLMRMENCQNLRFSGVTYKRPAFWGIHLVDCQDVYFNAVTVRFRNNGYNNDGLDLDGCQNVLIENCDINAGDDAICLKSSLHPCKNITVKNCRVSSNTAPLKFGTSSRGGFINVSVTNCYFYDSPMGAIKLQLVDGGRLENVEISRIVMENVGNPIFLRLGNRGSSFVRNDNAKPETTPVGTLKNIRLSDITATVTTETKEQASKFALKRNSIANRSDAEWTRMGKTRSGPIMITGIPGHYIEDVVLENITISYPGGGTAEEGKAVVPEDEDRYPEQFFFGILPSWGAYIRHARNVTFKNVTLTTRTPDARQRIILDDVEGFVEK